MRKYLQHILIVVILAFLVLVIALVYWQVLKSSELLARPDNPRPRSEQLVSPPAELLTTEQ